jgi:gamma-glutamylcyclotransferase (GGCT)/AIG2-like uncharacterized protein YtfP
METNFYAFYGSLRRGLENYETYQSHLHYQFNCWINGFQLFSMGDFPFAIKTDKGSDKILVEVFEITDVETQNKIDELELNYDYYIDTILIDKMPVKIYLMKNSANYPPVIGGDWVKFFRS